jgi:PAS domain S-box-containing protein
MGKNFIAKALKLCLPFLLLTLLWATAATAQSKPQLLVLTAAQGEYPLGRRLDILEDPGGQLTIEQVASPEYERQFMPSQSETPNFGYTDSAYWVRFRLRNESDLTDWRLELGFANMQHVALYTPLAQSSLPSVATPGFAVKQTGTFYPFNTRDEAYHHFVFKLSLPTQTEQTFYLRFQNEASLTLPLTLWSPEAFAQASRSGAFIWGSFYGILLIMIGYNAFLLLSLRDKNYLYYILFIAAFLLFQASFGGHAQQYLWPNLPGWNRLAVPIFSIAGTMTALNFTASFLELSARAPKLRRVWLMLQTVWGLLLLLTPFVSYGFIIRPIVGLVVISFSLMLGSSFMLWQWGYRPARFYALSWTTFLASIIVLALVRFGIIPSTGLTEQSYLAGAVLMVLLLSLALADRINLLKTEAEQAIHNLRTSERRLSQFLDALPVGVVIIDVQRTLQYVNRWTLQHFGVADRQIELGHNLDHIVAERFSIYRASSQELYPPEHRPLGLALQGKSSIADDIEIEQNGRRMTLEVRAQPIFDEQGQVQYAISVLQDISQRKQVEAELQHHRRHLEEQVAARTAELSRANEQLTQEIAERERIAEVLRLTQFTVDNAASPIFWLGQEGQFLYANQATSRMLNYSGETLLTMRFDEIDANYAPEAWASHWQSTQRHPVTVESYFRAKEGQTMPVSLTFTYLEFGDAGYNIVFARDISAQRWAAQALQENEERLRHIFSAISDHIYVTEITPAGEWINRYLSPTEALTGYPVDKFLEDWNFWASTLIHPDDRASAAIQAAQLADGKSSQVEYRMVRADGEIIWVRDSGRVEKELATGNLIIYGVVSEITERKQAEQALHFQKTLLESQMEAAPDGILVVAADGQQWLAVNQNFIEMWQLAPETQQSMSSELALQTQLEKVAEPEAFVAKINQLYANQEARSRDEILLKDGRIFDRYSGPVTSNDGIYYGRVWFYRDITARKQAELEVARLFEKQKRAEKSLRNVNQQLHERVEELAALNYITQAVATVSDLLLLLQMVAKAITGLFDAFSTGISLFNEARTERVISAMYQVRDADKLNLVGRVIPIAQDPIYLEYISQGKSVIIPAPQSNPFITALSRQIAVERNAQCLMIVPLRTRGDVVGTIAISTDQPGREFTQNDLRLAETVSGQLAGAVENARLFSAMQQEIAERKRAQEELAVARDQALAASRFKSQLLAKVSHELRTPLGAILGFTEMLEGGVYGHISAPQKEIIGDILESAHYLTNLVNELLDQAQLESGKLKLNLGLFSPAQLVRHVETSMRVLAYKNGLELLVDIAPDIPPTVSGDRARTRQILINLVGNAIKFTEQGQVAIRVYCANTTHWTMQVSDTGPGIPAPIQTIVFEPFQQADGSSTRKHRGYGLGLSIVKQLTELMGGQISLESEIGRGSTFTVELPLEI